MAMELATRDLRFSRQQEIPAFYVEEQVLLEIKSLIQVAPVHSKIVITYFRMTKCPVGLILNFNVNLMKEGIHRLIAFSAPSVNSVRN